LTHATGGIAVKTTNLGPRTPFYITRWEIEISRARAETYSLYRVHGFSRDPRICILDGTIQERSHLDPKLFLGIPI
jgi:Protein NO VEIN, C-terminal